MQDKLTNSEPGAPLQKARPARVLIDGSHILKRAATGIGSYTRTLARALNGRGVQLSVVYGQRQTKSHGDPDLIAASQVFGVEAQLPRWLQILNQVPRSAAIAVGGGRTMRASLIRSDGVEFGSFDPPLPATAEVWNADGLFDRAMRLFSMKRRFLDVRGPDTSVDAVHWTAPMPVHVPGIPNIYTIHDLIPLQFPHFVLDRHGRTAQLNFEVAKRADLIVTISDASRDKIVELLGVPSSRVAVTYQPAPKPPKVPKEQGERLIQSVYNVTPGEYVLFVGAIEPKKNLARLIESYLMAGITAPLIIAGPLGWLYEPELELLEAIQGQGTATRIAGNMGANGFSGSFRAEYPSVRRLGFLPRRHIVALMQSAKFLAFPSIYEGFGLPVLEAMALGTPVLTSKSSSLPEVAGDAAVLVDPLDLNEICDGIRQLDSDADLRAELSRRGILQAAKFSQEIYQARLADAYRRVGVEI